MDAVLSPDIELAAEHELLCACCRAVAISAEVFPHSGEWLKSGEGVGAFSSSDGESRITGSCSAGTRVNSVEARGAWVAKLEDLCASSFSPVDVLVDLAEDVSLDLAEGFCGFDFEASIGCGRG